MFSGILAHLQPGIAAVRRFYLPFLLVQSVSLLIVISYYNYLPFQDFCARLGQWKVQGGLVFAALATVFAGGILPEIFKALTGKLDLKDGLKSYLTHLFWVCLMYGFTGILVERFYWLQGYLFSTEISPSTVVTKVFVDQFLFSPFIALPPAMLYFLWLEEGCNLRRTWNRITPRLMVERCLPLIFPNWVYWIPMNFCTYSLPPDLQFPLFLTGLAAWSMIFIFIVQQPSLAPKDLPLRSTESLDKSPTTDLN